MKADFDPELHFMAEVDAVPVPGRDDGLSSARLHRWQACLSQDLDACRLRDDGLRAQGALARQVQAIDAALQAHRGTWLRRWEELAPAREVAEEFRDRVVLLVFGKFNAGKSSLCNFIAERFVARGRAVSWFHVDHGRVQVSDEPFSEGSTETTARLQGVRLGRRLVLLDTPGLHSVTPENAELSRRFTDAADGVLWLTSSSSPGQVQELEELARELHRNKPLLPVLTRSDRYEENEVDGRIHRILRNKDADNRILQEDDVSARACRKLQAMGLDPGLLQAPCSVSVHAARGEWQTPAAMAAAGFGQLYAALHDIVAPALAYRDTKPAAMLLHHFEENVLGTLLDDLLPRLEALDASLQALALQGEASGDRAVDVVLRVVKPALPTLLDRHAAKGDAMAVADALSQHLHEAMVAALDEAWPEFALSVPACAARIALPADAGYEGVAGDDAGNIDWTRLHATLSDAIHVQLRGFCASMATQSAAVVDGVRDDVARLHAAIVRHQHGLLEHRQWLHARDD